MKFKLRMAALVRTSLMLSAVVSDIGIEYIYFKVVQHPDFLSSLLVSRLSLSQLDSEY
jgi:hypothetical protein